MYIYILYCMIGDMTGYYGGVMVHRENRGGIIMGTPWNQVSPTMVVPHIYVIYVCWFMNSIDY